MITHHLGLVALSAQGVKPLLSATEDYPVHLMGVDIGDRIRAARTRAGLTQRALASLLGVDKSAVAQWEGNIVGIKTTNLVEVARILGIMPSELLGQPSPDDRLVLEDRDEITLIMLYRRLPKKLRDIHRQMLAVQTETSQLPERSSHIADRRELTA